MTNFIHRLTLVPAMLGIVCMAACSTAPLQDDAAAAAQADIGDDHSTILLVSMEDGSIVRQTLELDADICIKDLESSETTCLSQGEAIVNNSGIVVGYEMHTETIELQGLN